MLEKPSEPPEVMSGEQTGKARHDDTTLKNACGNHDNTDPSFTTAAKLAGPYLNAKSVLEFVAKFHACTMNVLEIAKHAVHRVGPQNQSIG